MSQIAAVDLTVRGEAIERVYASHTSSKYIVNRRYQRKLIWTQEEKVAFIDSIAQGFPVPIILLAEDRKSGAGTYEIIDGMQRLNAVTSFIENDYTVGDGYFDLNAMAVTKAALDAGEITQKEPILDRNVCVAIASYQLPFSIYEFADGKTVDEVFRRINSGGRKLSRQELRAAGSTGHFSQVVRKLGAKIRGDDSNSDFLTLNDMKKISVTNKELDYGLPVEKIFWVANSILTKEQVRESRDEELVADIVAYMVLDTPVSSRSEFIDDFFDPSEDEASNKRFNDVETAVQMRTPTLVIQDFQRTLDELILIVSYSGKNFGQLIFDGPTTRSPRYFQSVFLAFYELIIKRRKIPHDKDFLVARMTGSHGSISVPEGGRWGASDRQDAVNALIGVYDRGFADDKNVDPAVVHWVTQLQNILSQSYTEQNSYDFKQGFTLLDGSNVFDEESFEKILKTCVAISNIRRDVRGYVLVGVADKVQTAQRIEQLYGAKPIPFERFFITGVEHEAVVDEKTLEQFFQTIIGRINRSSVSEDLKGFLSRNLKSVRYYDKTVFVFEVHAQNEPSLYDGKYYERNGPNVVEIPTSGLGSLFRRF